MLGGILAVIIKNTVSAGGPSNVAHISKDRINLFNFNPDPTIRHTFWTLVIGAIPHYFYTAITQAGVQRIMSTPHPNVARRMLYISAPIYCIAMVVVMFEGLSVFAYYSFRGCDPLASGQISNPNQIIPFTILEMFHNLHGMPGLFIAALAAASLSTISSGLSGLAAVTCVDILKVLKPDINDQKSTNISKLFVVMYGIVSASVAFFLSNVKGPLGEIMAGFTGAVAGPETGMFFVSVFFRRCRPKAVFFATCVGLVVSLWLIFGQTFSSDLTRTPYLPLGPTDQCPNSTKNGSFTIYLENAQTVSTSTVSTAWSSAATKAMESKQLSGLKVFYSISFMYFHLIGTIITIIVAVIGSIIPLPIQKQRAMVDERCILQLSIFIPSICRRLYRKKEQVKLNGFVKDENEDMLKEEKSTSI
ncbi:sodium-coupled monocarboxylate transporter 1-like [Mercenaria mercenaria]|uniref:sodium-coupled monocarboxylate transporter 1-like n=1 Tax=Mercenaria mercenaria TaxID=6596 RepID=UPI00234E8609|nr:sodium-coupled monocarboxylate transporter 1-like [Mercenaria mercenaria]